MDEILRERSDRRQSRGSSGADSPARGPRLRLEPLHSRHVQAAAAPLAERHARHRAAEPLLAPADARAAVTALLDEGARGAVALRDGELLAYVLATPHDA